MPRMEWDDLVERHPGSGTVHARITPVRGSRNLRGLRNLLHKLMEKDAPAAAYATKLAPGEDATEVLRAFAETAQAEAFARRVGADRREAEAHRWHFELDAAKQVQLAGQVEELERDRQP
jgi:hypothetical protein